MISIYWWVADDISLTLFAYLPAISGGWRMKVSDLAQPPMLLDFFQVPLWKKTSVTANIHVCVGPKRRSQLRQVANMCRISDEYNWLVPHAEWCVCDCLDIDSLRSTRSERKTNSSSQNRITAHVFVATDWWISNQEWTSSYTGAVVCRNIRSAFRLSFMLTKVKRKIVRQSIFHENMTRDRKPAIWQWRTLRTSAHNCIPVNNYTSIQRRRQQLPKRRMPWRHSRTSNTSSMKVFRYKPADESAISFSRNSKFGAKWSMPEFSFVSYSLPWLMSLSMPIPRSK